MQLIVFAYDLCRILDCLIKKKNSSSNSFLNSAWKFDMKLLAGMGNTGKNTVKRFDTGLSLESTEIHDGLRPNIGSCFPRLPWSSQCRSSLSLLYYVLWEFCCLKLMSPLSSFIIVCVFTSAGVREGWIYFRTWPFSVNGIKFRWTELLHCCYLMRNKPAILQSDCKSEELVKKEKRRGVMVLFEAVI